MVHVERIYRVFMLAAVRPPAGRRIGNGEAPGRPAQWYRVDPFSSSQMVVRSPPLLLSSRESNPAGSGPGCVPIVARQGVFYGASGRPGPAAPPGRMESRYETTARPKCPASTHGVSRSYPTFTGSGTKKESRARRQDRTSSCRRSGTARWLS
jgi:hypothetical protein